MFCQHCGAELPGEGPVCPNCQAVTSIEPQKSDQPAITENLHAPFTDERKKKPHKVRKILSVIFGALFACAFIYLAVLSNDPYRNILEIDGMRDAYGAAQEVVLDILIAPDTAIFPVFKPEFVTQHTETIQFEDEEYRTRTVTAYVDADDDSGTQVRMDFVMKIGFPQGWKSGEEYYYEIVELGLPESASPRLQYEDSEGLYDLENGQYVEYLSSNLNAVLRDLNDATDYQKTAVVEMAAGRFVAFHGKILSVYDDGRVELQFSSQGIKPLAFCALLTVVPEQQNILFSLKEGDQIFAFAQLQEDSWDRYDNSYYYNSSEGVTLINTIFLSVNDTSLKIPYISEDIPGLIAASAPVASSYDESVLYKRR